MNLSDDIDNRITNKLPAQVRLQIEKNLPDMLATKFMHFITYELQPHVSKELASYINNNIQINLLFELHKKSLQQKLEEAVKDILDRLVADPKYHEITNAHLNAIDIKANEQLSKSWQQFKNELANMKLNVDNELTSLKDSLQRVENLKKDLKNMKREFSERMDGFEQKFYVSLTLFTFLTICLGT
ncbi:MAG: hypothetical protein Satyrvirus26_2 [Satyrvirus sp.]|uniref:Uncharacterized protein n=1 Tax=Satyrvirus sp. TaxID=2487771 RepID=A0A3G5AIJ1_9VIRU|nr:MAG: hypothetical protein Satyrvirus26_2 [Satyrvirus sp.]